MITKDAILNSALSRQTRGIAWPTVFLAAAILISFATVTALSFQGAIPAWIGVIVNSILAYMCYTPLHEACHGNIDRRAGKGDGLNYWIGVLITWPMMHNYSMHKTTHLSHHKNLNDPKLDADHYVAVKNPFILLFRLSTVVFSHYFVGSKINQHTKKGRQAIMRGLAENLIWVGFALGLALAGYWREVALFLLLPLIFGQIILSFTFDYMVHYPYQGTNRYTNTNIIWSKSKARANVITFLTLGQNVHLVHHLYPFVPFYRYATVFKDNEDALRSKGANIVEL